MKVHILGPPLPPPHPGKPDGWSPHPGPVPEPEGWSACKIQDRGEGGPSVRTSPWKRQPSFDGGFVHVLCFPGLHRTVTSLHIYGST